MTWQTVPSWQAQKQQKLLTQLLATYKEDSAQGPPAKGKGKGKGRSQSKPSWEWTCGSCQTSNYTRGTCRICGKSPTSSAVIGAASSKGKGDTPPQRQETAKSKIREDIDFKTALLGGVEASPKTTATIAGPMDLGTKEELDKLKDQDDDALREEVKSCESLIQQYRKLKISAGEAELTQRAALLRSLLMERKPEEQQLGHALALARKATEAKEKAEQELDLLRKKWEEAEQRLALARERETTAQKELERVRKMGAQEKQTPTDQWGPTLMETFNANLPTAPQMMTPQQLQELMQRTVEATQKSMQKYAPGPCSNRAYSGAAGAIEAAPASSRRRSNEGCWRSRDRRRKGPKSCQATGGTAAAASGPAGSPAPTATPAAASSWRSVMCCPSPSDQVQHAGRDQARGLPPTEDEYTTPMGGAHGCDLTWGYRLVLGLQAVISPDGCMTRTGVSTSPAAAGAAVQRRRKSTRELVCDLIRGVSQRIARWMTCMTLFCLHMCLWYLASVGLWWGEHCVYVRQRVAYRKQHWIWTVAFTVWTQALSLGPPKRVELTVSSEQTEYCGRARRLPSTQVPDMAKQRERGAPGKHVHSREAAYVQELFGTVL